MHKGKEEERFETTERREDEDTEIEKEYQGQRDNEWKKEKPSFLISQSAGDENLTIVCLDFWDCW